MKKIALGFILIYSLLLGCFDGEDFVGNTIEGYSSKEYELTIINFTSEGIIKEYREAGSGFIEIKEIDILKKIGYWNKIKIVLIRKYGASAFGMPAFSFIKLLDENENELLSDIAKEDDLYNNIEYSF
jgi:hypothetical protein